MGRSQIPCFRLKAPARRANHGAPRPPDAGKVPARADHPLRAATPPRLVNRSSSRPYKTSTYRYHVPDSRRRGKARRPAKSEKWGVVRGGLELKVVQCTVEGARWKVRSRKWGVGIGSGTLDARTKINNKKIK